MFEEGEVPLSVKYNTSYRKFWK